MRQSPGPPVADHSRRTDLLHLARSARHNARSESRAGTRGSFHAATCRRRGLWREFAPYRRHYMSPVRTWAALASVGLAVSAATVASGMPASASATSGRAMLSGSLTPSVERSKPDGHVAAGSLVRFDLVLNLRDAAGAQAIVKAVSTPGSAQYRKYLTDAQWIARYAPTQASVAAAETWLRAQGFKVGAVPSDRLFVAA